MDEHEELVWMAGIVDGGGSIMIQRVTRKHGLHPEYRLVLRINLSVGQDMSMFTKRFGSKIYPGKALTDKQRPYRIWLVYNKTASSALAALLPYLIWKKDKAELAILFQERCCKVDRSRLSTKELDEREEFYQVMKKLNFRGRVPLSEVESVVSTGESAQQGESNNKENTQ